MSEGKHRLASSQECIPVHSSACAAGVGELKQPYLPCCRGHPSDQGHKVLAEALVGPLFRAVAEVAALKSLPPAMAAALLQPLGIAADGSKYSRQDLRLAGLPPPMIPGNLEASTVMCSMQARNGAGTIGDMKGRIALNFA